MNLFPLTLALVLLVAAFAPLAAQTPPADPAAGMSYSAAMAKPYGAASPVPVAVPVHLSETESPTIGHPTTPSHSDVQTSSATTTVTGDETIVTASGQTVSTSSATKDTLFAGTEKFAKNATGVTEIAMDPSTLAQVSGNAMDAAQSMKLSIVRTYSYDKPGMYNMADVDEIRKRLDTGDWHCSVHVRDPKESTDICSHPRTDGYSETAIITVNPKELTFIHTIRKENNGGHKKDKSTLMPLGVPDGLDLSALAALNISIPAIPAVPAVR